MIEARNIVKTYQGKHALNGASFKVNAGEIFCLLGANRVVKKTSINLFHNFIQPVSVKVLINDLALVANALATKKKLNPLQVLILKPAMNFLNNN
ncbi:MAG: hypothetical protein EBR30_29595 [Cytophagia bacterium]|nr:hypothetical protein [Cytophagia bacterium]